MGLYLREKLTVRQTPGHAPFRSICLFGFQENEPVILQELTIKNNEGKNSTEFVALMKDYYG